MTLATPAALLGLVALPLFAAWYVRRQRGRERDRAAFTSAVLAPSVAPQRPGWRRHAPVLAFVAALCVLVVALAGPRTSAAVAVRRAAVMLACDVSGSMAATDVAPSRLVAAERAGARFLDGVPDHLSVGVMTFNQQPEVLESPTTDRVADRRALRGWRPHGGTAIGNAIRTALDQLTRGPKRTRVPAAIVLLSDGSSTSGVDALSLAREAARRHVPIYTVALGTAAGTITVRGPRGARVTRPVPPDPAVLRQVAHITHGLTFSARDAGRLSAVYAHLGAKLGHRKVTRTLEAGFAGAALALLVLGAALSLRWFGRLI